MIPVLVPLSPIGIADAVKIANDSSLCEIVRLIEDALSARSAALCEAENYDCHCKDAGYAKAHETPADVAQHERWRDEAMTAYEKHVAEFNIILRRIEIASKVHEGVKAFVGARGEA